MLHGGAAKLQLAVRLPLPVSHLQVLNGPLPHQIGSRATSDTCGVRLMYTDLNSPVMAAEGDIH